MDILGQSALIAAVAAFSLAVTALSRNLRNKLVLAYALLCSVLSAWAFCFFLEKIFVTGMFYRLHLVFNLLLAPTGLFFVRVLTRVETAFMRWLTRLAAAYAAAAMGMLWWFEYQSIDELPWLRALAFFGPSFLVVVCLYLMLTDWRLKRGALLRSKISTVGLSRRSWIYFGALSLLATATMDHMPGLGDVIPSFGNILLCLYLFLISEAIIHQRLLNVSALLNRVVVLVFISMCFTLVYTLLVAWVDNSPSLFLLNTFIASFIILMLIDPIKKLTSIGVMRIFSRKYLKLESKVGEAQLQLTGILDTMGLAQLTLQFLETTLRFESASVFVLRSDGSKLRRIRGVRDEDLVNREILANNPLVEFFGRMRRRGEIPVVLDHYLENEIDRTTSQVQRETFDHVLKAMLGLNANIAIPFMDGATVLGVVAVRASSPPEPWGNSWGVLSAVYPFFLQAARTLKNMDVYVRLREKDRLAALGEMAAGLAHEIRNPLGAIKGAAQYLEPQKDGPHSAFLRVIVEEVNRLNKVVTQFLDYSRPLSADLVAFDLTQILERTFALFQSSDIPAAIQIRLIPSENGPVLPRALCAPEQIKQVLVNLVQNAIHSLATFLPDGGGVILIGVDLQKRMKDGGEELVVFVEDNGKGISRENMDKIFIPFFTTSPSGTGLGLPICSRIVEAHGGRIEVSSEEGKFTRFSVYLPVSDILNQDKKVLV